MEKDCSNIKEDIDNHHNSLFDDELFTGDKDNNRLMELYALTRTKDKAKTPNVEKEWKKFRSERMSIQGNAFSIKRKWIWSAAAVLFVGFLSAVTLFGYMDNREKEISLAENYQGGYIIKDNGNIFAFQANDGPKVVMIGNSRHEMKPIESKMECGNVKADPEKAIVCPLSNLDAATRTITTPRGATYEITLADGTVVKLNGDSRLSFPTAFTGKERIVTLGGEAYFKVTSDKEHPFVVHSQRLTTTVLGTEFDIKDYDDSPAEVTLVSGMVKVMPNTEDSKDITLDPDRYVRFIKGHDLHALKCDAKQRTKWTEDLFSYHNVQLLTVLKDMGRWYNVDIEMCDTTISSYPVNLEISRSCSLKDFTDKLSSLGFLSISLEGEKIVCSMRGKSVPAVQIIPQSGI